MRELAVYGDTASLFSKVWKEMPGDDAKAEFELPD